MELIQKKQPNSLIRNGQGDITGLINSSGRAVIEYRYDTWGRDCSLLPEYQEYLELQELNPFRYRGYVYDTETGWYYLQSRYYDPATCRFISADILLSTGQGVLGHNTFAYCGNNPISRIDLNGYDWEDFREWLKSIFSGGNSSCSGETQTADEVKTVEVVLTPVPSTPEPISSSAKYPPVVDAYINEARQMIGDPYDERDCAQLVRASVLEYDEGFRRGARYQWAEYNSFLWEREVESDIAKIPPGALLYYQDENGSIVHTAIYLGGGMMIDSTDREDIYGVSEREVDSGLTFAGKPINIVGYLYPRHLFGS